MTRALLLAAALLLGGCYESFQPTHCMPFCEGCGISDCKDWCGRLEHASTLPDESCNTAADAEWTCALRRGCDFPLQCRAEYAALVECGGRS